MTRDLRRTRAQGCMTEVVKEISKKENPAVLTNAGPTSATGRIYTRPLIRRKMVTSLQDLGQIFELQEHGYSILASHGGLGLSIQHLSDLVFSILAPRRPRSAHNALHIPHHREEEQPMDLVHHQHVSCHLHTVTDTDQALHV